MDNEKRRVVSDQEFADAYENKDNRSIIKKVCNGYRKVLPEDSREDCGMVGLWRALQYHRGEFNQKFTSSLYRFVDWECKREFRKLYGRKRYRQTVSFVQWTPDAEQATCVVHDLTIKEDLEHLQACMDKLHPDDREILKQYYFKDLTMTEIGFRRSFSKECARDRIEKALQNLRRVSQAELSETV